MKNVENYEIDLNNKECIVKKNDFTSTEYVNICTKESTIIEYTNFEKLMTYSITGVLLACLLFILFMLITGIKEFIQSLFL